MSLDDLLQSWKLGSSSTTPPRYPHRFLDLLQRMRRASENPGNLIADDAAAVAAAEVSGLMQTFDGWREDPVWPEFQSAFRDPRNFLHAVVTLSMASALRERHQRTELVASGVQGGSADLRMVVTEHDWLEVEVKTSLALSNRSTAMQFSEALKFVTIQLRRPTKGGRRQLGEDRPGMLVIGGVEIDNATSPSGSSSGARTSASASPSGAVVAQLNCRLPIVTYGTFDPRAVTASGAGGQGANVGFFQFPNGPAVNEPNDLIGWDPTRFRTRTLRQPVLESGGQSWSASWDAAAGRWVPVEAALVAPDGTAYAWTEDPSPESRTTRIHVTTVSSGHDVVVLTSGAGTISDLGYGVVRYDNGFLLLTQLAGSEGGIYNANHGLWRFDLRSAKLSQLAPPTLHWTLLSAHAAWSSDVDPTGGPPVAAPSPDVGVMPDRLIRVDLQAGAETTWISRPGTILTVLGVDLNDHPLLRIQSASSTEVDYSTAPDQTLTVYRSAAGPVYGPSDDLNATGAGYAPQQVVVDSHGIWLAHAPGEPVKLVLFNLANGLQPLPSLGSFDSVHAWHPAGDCI